MKKFQLISALLLAAALLALPIAAMAANGQQTKISLQDCMPSAGQQDRVVFGEDCILQSGQVIPGSLVVFGGDVTVEAGAEVGKDLVIFGGDVSMDGRIDRGIFALGGEVTLGPNAVVEGDVVAPGGQIHSDPAAQILGNRFSNVGPDFSPGFNVGWGSFVLGKTVSLVFMALAMSAVAVLVALFVPDYLQRTAGSVVKRPLESGGLGCLTFILLIPVMLITLITLIGPFIILFLFIVALAFGWVALGYELGRRISMMFKQDWTIVLEAWVGTLALGIVVSFIGIVPCIGWIAGALVGAIGLGAVLLSRFGTLGEAGPVIVTPKPEKRTPRSPMVKSKRSTRRATK